MIQAILKTVDTNNKQELEVRLEELENKLDFLDEREKELKLEIAKGDRAKQILPIILKEKQETAEEYKILFLYYYRKEKEA